MKNRKQKAIDEILNNFDFEIVHRAIVLLDLKWTASNVIPDISDLRSEAIELLNDVVSHKYCTSVGNGGFIARKEDNNISLEFNIAFKQELI